MRTWLTKLWDDLRSGFWFLPAVIITIGIGVALGMLVVDARFEESKALPTWLQTSAPAGRTTLSALAGALLTGTSVVFSITMLVLAQTASQYGSRILRTVADGNEAQVTLGLFLGTSVYCLLVLRSIRSDDFGIFVPHLSVAVGVLFGVFSLCALIYFVHETASSIQAQTVVRSVHGDLRDAIDRLFPTSVGEADPTDHEPFDDSVPENSFALTGVGLGYLQAIDTDSLLEIAVQNGLLVRIAVPPGTFITSQTTVAHVTNHGDANPGDEGEAVDLADLQKASLRHCFLLGPRRTPRQDVVCAVDELVEIAVRALSPGINDPITAMTCVDYLGAGLAQLAGRAIPERHRRDESGTVRIVVEPVTFSDVLDASLRTLTQHATDTPSVVIRLVETLANVAACIERDEDADALRDRVAWIGRLAEKRLNDDSAVELVLAATRRVEDELDSRRDVPS